MTGTGMGPLNQALQANANAYGGAANTLGQQYQQNAANVQQNAINQGLGNTTVADTLQQAPLQTYNTGMQNLLGQQQGAAANIYGQGASLGEQYAGLANQAAMNAATNAQSQTNSGIGAAPALGALTQESSQNAQNALNNMAAGSGPGQPAYDPYTFTPGTGGGVSPTDASAWANAGTGISYTGGGGIHGVTYLTLDELPQLSVGILRRTMRRHAKRRFR